MKMSRVIAFSNAFEVDRKLELSISMDLLCRNTHWKTFDDINGLHSNNSFSVHLKSRYEDKSYKQVVRLKIINNIIVVCRICYKTFSGNKILCNSSSVYL